MYSQLLLELTLYSHPANHSITTKQMKHNIHKILQYLPGPSQGAKSMGIKDSDNISLGAVSNTNNPRKISDLERVRIENSTKTQDDKFQLIICLHGVSKY